MVMKQWYALYVLLCSYNDVMTWKDFPHHPIFVERIYQLSVDTSKKLIGSGALGFPLLSKEQTVVSPVIWDVMVLNKRHCDVIGVISHTDDICRYKGYPIGMTE